MTLVKSGGPGVQPGKFVARLHIGSVTATPAFAGASHHQDVGQAVPLA
jgi:hypothetical protein